MRFRTSIQHAIVVSALACTTRSDARIELVADARIPRPQFTIGGSQVPRRIRIERRDVGLDDDQIQTVWLLMATPATTPLVSTVLTYGEVPAGFAQAAPASALFPGRYALIADSRNGSSLIEFRVESDGRVTPRFSLR